MENIYHFSDEQSKKETKEVIRKACYGCILIATCTTICDKYFDEVNKFLDHGLYKYNWMSADKSICDDSAIFIAKIKRRPKSISQESEK